jgi:hypothetical protein
VFQNFAIRTWRAGQRPMRANLDRLVRPKERHDPEANGFACVWLVLALSLRSRGGS